MSEQTDSWIDDSWSHFLAATWDSLMTSSDEAAGAVELGAFLSGTEAKQLADRLSDGDTLTSALNAVAPARRARARKLMQQAGLGLKQPDLAVGILRAVEGAHSTTSVVTPMWTLPGHLANAGPLTSTIVKAVQGARQSITCSTFNFQRTSGLWKALESAIEKPGLQLTVYIDARAADKKGNAKSPTTQEVAEHLHPGAVFRSKKYAGKQVTNHAKFLVIDHRFVLVTSANFSYMAEQANVELGLRLDDKGLAESIERQMLDVQTSVYELVKATNSQG